MQNLTKIIKKGYSVRVDKKLVKEITKQEKNRSVFIRYSPSPKEEKGEELSKEIQRNIHRDTLIYAPPA